MAAYSILTKNDDGIISLLDTAFNWRGERIASHHSEFKMKVGFVGLGRMERGMAFNFKAEADLTVFDVDPAAAVSIHDADAKLAMSISLMFHGFYSRPHPLWNKDIWSA